MASKRTLNLGIAGLGLAGGGMVAPALGAMPGVDLVAACDLNPRALEAFATKYQVRTNATIEAMCADPEIDVVWVATPNLLHAQHSILAMEHGKHVIVEKPMALS